ILSLLETAKRHGLDAEKYMTYLLEHLPNEETLAKKEVLEAYLGSIISVVGKSTVEIM
ncbi:transposase domain-containing protein, partial [Streptococcus suis]